MQNDSRTNPTVTAYAVPPPFTQGRLRSGGAETIPPRFAAQNPPLFAGGGFVVVEKAGATQRILAWEA